MSRRGGKKFSYQKRDYKQARKRAEQHAGSRDNYIKDVVDLYKPGEGDNLIRIIPPTWEGNDHYGLDIYVHYNVGPDSAAYLCLNKMLDEPCPICEERNRAEAEGDKDYAKKLRPTKRVLFYLVDRDKEAEGIKAWASPWTIDKDIMIQSTDSRTQEFYAVDDPDEGYDITIKREGTGERTEYTVRMARRESELDLTDAMLDIMEDTPIPEILQYFPYDRIAQVFGGQSAPAATTKDDDDDDKPARSSRRSREPEPEIDDTWEDVQETEGEKLDDLVEKYKLELDPGEFGSDQELADAICEELGLRKTEEKEPEPEKKEEKEPVRRRTSRRSAKEDKDDDDDDKDDKKDDDDDDDKKSDKGDSVRSRLANLRKRS